MKRASAATLLLGVLVAVPLALVRLGGGPAIPSFEGVRLTDTYMPLDPILQVVALLTWIVWAYVAAAATLRAIAVVSVRAGGSQTLMTASSTFTPKSLRVWIDFAIGGALLAASINPRIGANLQPAARVQAVTQVEAPKTNNGEEAAKAKSRTPLYKVRSGDSLWRIAERKLGSGFRWREIFDLNRGKSFSHGHRLSDPRLIQPGWVLELPNELSRHTGARPLVTRAEIERNSVDRQPGSSAHAQAEPPRPTQQSRPAGRPTVQLPSGLVVATSFASGVMAAELLARMKRRRRYRPLSDAIEHPADTHLVRDLRSPDTEKTSILALAIDAINDVWKELFGETPPLMGALEHERRVVAFLTDTGRRLPSEIGGKVSPRIRFRPCQGFVQAEVMGPFAPHLGRPEVGTEGHGLVPFGYAADGSALHLSPFVLGVTSAEGPRSEEMALQMLLTAASSSSPDDLQITLLGVGDALREMDVLPHVARCVAWDDATETLREIQSELLRRARLLMHEDAGDMPAHRLLSDAAFFGLLIVAGAPPEAFRGVVEAVAVEAPRFGAALIAVGWEPRGTSLHAVVADSVDFRSTLLPQHKALTPFLLDRARAREAADVIREAYADDEAGPEHADIEQDVSPEPASSIAVLSRDPHEQAEPEIAPSRHADVPASVVLSPPPPPLPNEDSSPRAEIRCLGPVVVARSDGSIPAKGWRAPAKELLAYLVLHPDGAHKERIAEVLFPGTPLKKATDLIARAASVVRTRVRTSNDDGKYVELEGETWRLERGSWRVDVWEMERLAFEDRSLGLDEAIRKLRAALALYRGEFCDDTYFAWAQQTRERYRALFLRVSARLAERLYDAGEREEALAALDHAIQIEPLCEDLYRRAMVIESSLGRRQEALVRFGRLKQRLEAELNCAPDPETERLARDIERVQVRQFSESVSG